MLILFITILLVILSSALTSGSEAALFSTPMIKVKQLAEEKVSRADALLKIRQQMSRPIALIVILNNIANIVGSMVIGILAAEALGSQWLGLFSAILTLLVIIFAEIIPKTIGEKYNEKIALFIAKPVLILTKVFLPLIWLIEQITKPFTTKSTDTPTTDEKEISYLAKIGEQEGMIEQDELEMIKRIFRLNDLTARDVMTPRVAMTNLPADKTINQVIEMVMESQHSRMVAIGETQDQVQGFVLRSELMASHIKGNGDDLIKNYLVEPAFVNENTKVDDLLPMFQSRRKLLAIVTDDFNGVSGIVTLEDVVEEITGEIVDETDMDEDMRKISIPTSVTD